MLLYVIGFTRAGKSSLAKSLASTWQIPAYDTDEIFCLEEQREIADYVSEHGWSAFRKRESEILQGSLAYKPGFPFTFGQYSGIVACGGGIVEDCANRALLKQQRVLWLAPTLETILCRIRVSPSEYVRGKNENDIAREYYRRLTLYRDCLS